MAQVLDSFGRAAEDATMSLKQLRELIKSLAQGKVGPPTSPGQAAQDAGVKMPMPTPDVKPDPNSVDPKVIEEMRDILKEYKKDWDKETDDAKKHVEDTVDLLKNIDQAKEAKSKQPKGVGKDKPSKEDVSMEHSLAQLAHHGLKKGSIQTADWKMFSHVVKADGITQSKLEQIVQLLDKSAKVSKGIKPGTFKVETDLNLSTVKKQVEKEAPGAYKAGKTKRDDSYSAHPAHKALAEMRLEPLVRELSFMKEVLTSITGVLDKMQDAFFGFKVGETLFKGIVKEETKFIRDARAAAYETAGITKETRALQRAYEDIGTTAAITGFNRTEYQKAYLKTLKRGIKDLGTVNKITQAQLNTESQIGVEAGTLSDEFANWHTQMRFNAGQVAEMGRGVRDVAKFTGITGEKLAQAVKSSEQFMTTMRNAATLTASAAKNIIEIQAVSQKMGTADTMAPLMKAMTSTNNLIREASNQTRALLINAAAKVGRVRELMMGTILQSKAGIKDMAKGLEANLRMFGVNSIEEIDNLSDEAKQRLNLQLKAAFGIELGEMRQTIETLKEAGKGLGDRIADINKKLQQNVTIEERKALEEQKRAMTASASLSVLNALDEAAKGAQDMNQALAKFGTRRKQFQDDLNAMGITATDNADVARQAIGTALANINQSLKAGGKQELKIDSSQIEKALQDPVAFRELQAQLTKAEQQAATAAKAQLDPVSEIRQKVNEINDNIRNMSQNVISKLMNSMLGKLAFIAIAIMSVVSTVGLFLIGLYMLKRELGTMLQFVGPSLMKIFDLFKSKLFGGGPTTPAPKGPTTPDAALDIVDKRKKEGKEKTTEAEKKTKTPCDPCPLLTEIVKLLSAIKDCVCQGKEPTIKTAVVDSKGKIIPEEKRAEAAAGMNKYQGMTQEQKATEKLKERKGVTTPTAALPTPQTLPKATETTAAMPKKAEAAAGAAATAVKEKTTCDTCPILKEIAGSIKALDPTMKEMAGKVAALEPVVKAIDPSLKAIASALAPLADIKTLLDAIKQCVCQPKTEQATQAAQPEAKKTTTTPAATAQATATAAATAPAKKIEGLEDPAVVKAKLKQINNDSKLTTVEKKMQTKELVMQRKEIIMQKKAIPLQKREIATEKAREGLVKGQKKEMAKAEPAEPPPTAPSGGWDLESLKKSGPEMAKTAAAILIMAVGVVALGAAIVFLSHKVIKAFNLDMKTVLETAGIVAALAGAGAAIAVAAYGVIEALESKEVQDFVGKAKKGWKDLAKTAAAILIIGPAVVLLGAAVVGATAAILKAFNLNLTTVIETAAVVTAVAGAATAIIVAASKALECMEEMNSLPGAKKLMQNPVKMAWTMAKAGLAMLILAPAIVFLGAAVIKMAQWILGIFNLDARTAMEVGATVAAVILSAGLIAGAIIGAMFGLYGLGLLVDWMYSDPTFIPHITQGAIALLILAPLVLLLAAAVTKFAQWILGAFKLSAKDALDTGMTVAAVIVGAGLIAGAIIGAMYGLYGLGLLAKYAMKYAWTIAMGALALLILTPVMIKLALVIIDMANSLIDLSPKDVENIVNKVTALFEGAGKIALAVLLASGALALLGMAVASGYILYAALMMGLGALALLVLTPAMIKMALAILNMGKELTESISLEEAKKIAEGVKTIFTAAGDVAGAVVDMSGYLLKMGFLSFLNLFGFVTGLLNKGAAFFFEIAKPIGNFVMGLMAMGKAMTQTMPMDQAKKTAEGVKTIFESAGVISDNVQSSVWSLIKMGFLSILNRGGWITSLMDAGAGFFMDLAKPVAKFTLSILALGKAMSQAIDPAKAREIAKGVKDIFDAAAAVNQSLTSQMSTLIKLGMLSWFSFLIPDLDKATEFFMSLAKPAMKFTLILIALGRALVAAAGGPKKIKPLIEGIKGIGEIIEAVSKIMDILIKKIVPMTQAKWFGLFGSSQLEDLADAVPKFRASFESITTFIRDGIIMPIRRTFRNTAQIQKTLAIAKGLADAMQAAAKIMDTVIKSVLPLTRPWFLGWWGNSRLDDLADAIPKFQKSFEKIVDFIKNAIIEPIRSAFRNTKKIAAVIGVAKAIAQAMQAVLPMVNSVQKAVSDLTQARGFFSFIGIGDSKMEQLEKAIPGFQGTFQKIVDFVKNGIIEPIRRAFPHLKKVQPIIAIAKGIGDTVLSIVNMVDTVANKLVPMTERGGIWASMFGDARSQMEKIDALLTGSFQKIFSSMVNFLKNGLIGPITSAFPNLQQVNTILPVVNGVGNAVTAIANMVDALINKLMPLAEKPGFWGRIFGETKSKFEQLEEVIPTIGAMWSSIVYFVRDGLIGPVVRAFPCLKEAESQIKTVELVGKSIKTVADVMETVKEIQQNIDPLAGIRSIFGDIFPKVNPLEKAIPMIQATFIAITKFVKEGIIEPVQSMDANGLKQSVTKLEQMNKAFQLMQDLVDSLQGMMGMTEGGTVSKTTGPWYWRTTVVEKVDPMTDKLQAAIKPISDTFKKITQFVQDGIVVPVSKLDAGDLKKTVKILMWMALALEKVPEVMENLGDVLKMLSPDGNALQSHLATQMINEMQGRWKGWYKWVFTGMATFIKDGIMDPILKNLTDVKKVKTVAKIIMAAAIMLDKLPDMMENLGDALRLLSPDGNALQSHLATQMINEMQGRWKGWYKWVFTGMATFIREGIIDPISKELTDVKKVKTVAKIVVAAAMMLEKLPTMMEGLGNALRLLSPDGNVLQSALATQIINEMQGRWKGWYKWVFTGMAAFIREGIMDPISKNLTEVDKVQTVAKILVAAATMMTKLPPVMQNLGDALRLLSPDGNVLQTALVSQIQGEMNGRWKGWYAKTFTDIAKFIREGIVNPVLGELYDAKTIMTAAKILVAAAQILTVLPVVMQKLGDALRLLSPDGNVLQSALTTQMQNEMAGRWKGWYEKTFRSIAIFMREGIVNPILQELPNVKDIVMAARLMRAMSVILTSLPRVITALASAMGLMSNPDSLRDAPGEKIMEHKEEFRVWFKNIAIFMRDAIVNPILDELPDVKSVLMAARLMRAMSVVISSIPRVILGMANGLMPLVDSGMTLRDTPADKINDSKDEFKEWFRQVAIFMRDGIVAPILEELPDVKSILMAARILRAMSIVVSGVAAIIKNISKVFGTLKPSECINDSPMSMIAAAAPIFADWFMTLTDFLVGGIIDPILLYFPNKEEVAVVVDALRQMINVIRLLPAFLNELSAEIAPMIDGSWMRASPISRIASGVIIFGAWFGALANALIVGIINPIKNEFPKPEEIGQMFNSMQTMNGLLASMPEFLEDLGDQMSKIYDSPIWDEGMKMQVTVFSAYFKHISDALVKGIVTPVEAWPKSAMLQEMVARLRAMSDAVKAVAEVLETFSNKLGPLVNGYWWYSPELSDLSRRVGRFSTYFTGIALSLRDGIIKPIQDNFPAATELQEIVTRVTALNDVIHNLSGAMTELAATIAELNAINMPDLDPEVLGRIAGILNRLALPPAMAPVQTVSFSNPEVSFDPNQFAPPEIQLAAPEVQPASFQMPDAQVLTPPAAPQVQMPTPQALTPPAAPQLQMPMPQVQPASFQVPGSSFQMPAPQVLTPPAAPQVQMPAPQVLTPPAAPQVQMPAPQAQIPAAPQLQMPTPQVRPASFQMPAPQALTPPAAPQLQMPTPQVRPASFQMPAPQALTPPAAPQLQMPTPQVRPAAPLQLPRPQAQQPQMPQQVQNLQIPQVQQVTMPQVQQLQIPQLQNLQIPQVQQLQIPQAQQVQVPPVPAIPSPAQLQQAGATVRPPTITQANIGANAGAAGAGALGGTPTPTPAAPATPATPTPPTPRAPAQGRPATGRPATGRPAAMPGMPMPPAPAAPATPAPTGNWFSRLMPSWMGGTPTPAPAATPATPTPPTPRAPTPGRPAQGRPATGRPATPAAMPGMPMPPAPAAPATPAPTGNWFSRMLPSWMGGTPTPTTPAAMPATPRPPVRPPVTRPAPVQGTATLQQGQITGTTGNITPPAVTDARARLNEANAPLQERLRAARERMSRRMTERRAQRGLPAIPTAPTTPATTMPAIPATTPATTMPVVPTAPGVAPGAPPTTPAPAGNWLTRMLPSWMGGTPTPAPATPAGPAAMPGMPMPPAPPAPATPAPTGNWLTRMLPSWMGGTPTPAAPQVTPGITPQPTDIPGPAVPQTPTAPTNLTPPTMPGATRPPRTVLPPVQRNTTRPPRTVLPPVQRDMTRPPQTVLPPVERDATRPPRTVLPPVQRDITRPPQTVLPPVERDATRPPATVLPPVERNTVRPPRTVLPPVERDATRPPRTVLPPVERDMTRPPRTVVPPVERNTVRPPRTVLPPVERDATRPPRTVLPPVERDATRPPRTVLPPVQRDATRPPRTVLPPVERNTVRPPRTVLPPVGSLTQPPMSAVAPPGLRPPTQQFNNLSMPMPMPMRNLASGDSTTSTVEGQSGQTAATPTAPQVRPLPPAQANMDTQRRVEQDRASSQPPVASISSPELGQIAASSQQTNSSMTQLVTLIQTLVNYMKPQNGTVGNSDSSGQGRGGTNMVVSSPPKYYKWNTGKHNQIAGKAVTNISASNY
jgi:hypothetical protein